MNIATLDGGQLHKQIVPSVLTLTFGSAPPAARNSLAFMAWYLPDGSTLSARPQSPFCSFSFSTIHTTLHTHTLTPVTLRTAWSPILNSWSSCPLLCNHFWCTCPNSKASLATLLLASNWLANSAIWVWLVDLISCWRASGEWSSVLPVTGRNSLSR